MEISAAILAGGLSTRFLSDKIQLTIEGENIILHQVRLLRSLFRDVFVVSNRKDRVPGLEEHCRVEVDAYPGKGPLGGIYTALSSSRTQWTFVLAGDMPFVNLGFIRWAATHLSEKVDALVPKDPKGFQPLCAFYRKSCLQTIQKKLESGNCKVMAMRPDVHLVELDIFSFPGIQDHPYLFYNINSREDWEKYLVLSQQY